ncbi:MAG: helix-turn-helix domain-containing protein [Janthinobacterium lividum]
MDPPRNALDRGQRHVWRRRVVAEARAGNLPGKAILTAEAMLACMGEGGELYPSHQALAEKAGVGLRTVARHLDRMSELGLIRKHRRLVRMPWPEGGRGAVRVQQTSNAYEVLFPMRTLCDRPPLRLRVNGRVNTGCHSGPEESGSRFIPAPEMDRTAAIRALEAVRVARSAALARQWSTTRGL